MNAATIRSFGEDKGIDFNSDALAVERNGVGYIIYVDKKDYAEATKVFESAYNTNVVVKQKSDMSKNQKIEYAMVKGGVDYSGVDQLLGLFNIFSSQTANPCQYNCSGISYVNLTGDLSGMEGALTNGATNAKFSIGLPDFISSIKEKGKEIKDNITGGKEQVVTDSNGNTYKVNEKEVPGYQASGNNTGSSSVKPEKAVTGSKKHGVNWNEGPARAKATGNPQGQWVKGDLDFATEKVNTLKPGESAYFDLPANSQSIVHTPDGTTVKATKIWIRNNGTGTWHGYPMP